MLNKNTMRSEARKIHLIEELLKINNDKMLSKVEELLDTFKEKKPAIYDFVGTLSKSDADKLRKAIDETNEVIDQDAWK